MNRPVRLDLRDTVLDPSASPPTVVYKERDTRPLYKVWLYLEGPDLSYVEAVTYRLHPTFPRPVQRIRRTPQNPTCELVIWTWGLFAVEATVELKDGRQATLTHNLSYDRQLKEKDLTYRKV